MPRLSRSCSDSALIQLPPIMPGKPRSIGRCGAATRLRQRRCERRAPRKPEPSRRRSKNRSHCSSRAARNSAGPRGARRVTISTCRRSRSASARDAWIALDEAACPPAKRRNGHTAQQCSRRSGPESRSHSRCAGQRELRSALLVRGTSRGGWNRPRRWLESSPPGKAMMERSTRCRRYGRPSKRAPSRQLRSVSARCSCMDQTKPNESSARAIGCAPPRPARRKNVRCSCWGSRGRRRRQMYSQFSRGSSPRTTARWWLGAARDARDRCVCDGAGAGRSANVGFDVASAVYRRGVGFCSARNFRMARGLCAAERFPVQPLKDSGFPHGKNQWISAAGTSWATMAIALALPPQPSSGTHPVIAERRRVYRRASFWRIRLTVSGVTPRYDASIHCGTRVASDG